MLKGIPNVLSPDLLACLQEMGHGDCLAIVDGNYPGANAGPKVIRLDGHSATDILDAVLLVMPLDRFVDQAAFCPKVENAAGERPQVLQEFTSIVERREPGMSVTPIDPAEFYRLANSSYALVQSGERRLFGNIVLKKGVILPE